MLPEPTDAEPFFSTTEGFITLCVSLFVLMLFALMYLRSKKKECEVKTPELMAAVLPVIVLLLVSGKVKSLQVGDVKVELAFEKAAQSPVKSDLESLEGKLELPVEHVEAFAKGAVSQIDHIRGSKAEGLTFVVGGGGYVAGAIREYLERIPSLRYVIVNQSDGSLFGVFEARGLKDTLASGADSFTFDNFTSALNRGDTDSLQHFPGVLLAKDAIAESTDRLSALKKMEELNADFIAAVDATGKFAGVIKRSRLTSSMLVDIAERVKR